MIQFQRIFACISLSAPLVFINGCSTLQTDRFTNELSPDENTGKIFRSIRDIPCQPLRLVPGKDKARIVINQYTARLDQAQGSTPVLAYSIPESGFHHIEISSYVVNPSWDKKGDELFYPEIALLDRNHNLVSRLDPSHIGYKKPGFTTGEGVSTSFNIDNRGNVEPKTACLLIYTTDELRKKTTTLLNEEKEFAKVRGVIPPPLPDPVARHGNNGHLAITLKSSDRPVAVTLPAVAATTPAAAVKSTPDPMGLKISQHYITEVQQALAQGEIARALDSRSELKSLVKNTEHYFMTQFGKPAKALMTTSAPNKQAGFAAQAEHYYQKKLHDLLKAGKGSLALELLDEVKQLQIDVDHLFDR